LPAIASDASRILVAAMAYVPECFDRNSLDVSLGDERSVHARDKEN
jgi:hypothetical protein